MLNLQTQSSSRPTVMPWQRGSGAPVERVRDPFEALSSAAIRMKVRRGDEIFADGDEPVFCYRIVSGNAMAYKLTPDGHRQVYEFLQQGDLLGFEAQGAYYFTVEAATDLIVLKYPRRAVDLLLAENPTFAHEIQRITARGLHSAYQRMLLLTHKTADERVAWFLLDMAERSKTREDAVHLTMSRTDIADYLGMVIETVSRALTKFRRAGAIAMRGVNDIQLVDRDRLETVRGEV